MKYTLLELSQDVLSSMDSDEINSISDSVEAQQVVKILKTVYDDIITRGDLVSNRTLFNLDASGDPDKPILMTKPATIDRIIWIKYNRILEDGVDPNWVELQYLKPEDFLTMSQNMNTSEATVDSLVLDISNLGGTIFTARIHYRNDVGPCYYTSFNDTTVVFDAYDSAVDSTLQTSKTLCSGNRKTDFVEEDTYIPNLQPNQFALLLNEAKSLAWAELKQTPHPKAERTAKRNWAHLSKTQRNIPTGRFGSGAHAFDSLPNFSRK